MTCFCLEACDCSDWLRRLCGIFGGWNNRSLAAIMPDALAAVMAFQGISARVGHQGTQLFHFYLPKLLLSSHYSASSSKN